MNILSPHHHSQKKRRRNLIRLFSPSSVIRHLSSVIRNPSSLLPRASSLFSLSSVIRPRSSVIRHPSSKKSRHALLIAICTLIVLLPLAIFLARTPRGALADAYFTFDEGYGTTDAINDVNGNLSPGSITNALWKDESMCKVGKCLYFDGTEDYVSFADNDSLDMAASDEVTINLWFRTGDILTGSRTLISKYETTGGDGGYQLYMNSDGKIAFGIDSDNSGFPLYSVTSANTYDDNKWHFVSVVKNGTSSMSIYIDAMHQGTTSITSTNASNDDTFYIGIDNTLSNGWLGFIDEVKIMRSARTADEVKTDFAGQTPSRGTASSFGPDQSYLSEGLVGYWNMDNAAENQTSPSDPGSGTNDNSFGSIAWTNPGNITASNNTRASATLSGNTNNTNYLFASNFGFSVPSGATIYGIQTRIERRRTGGTTGQARDNVVRLVKGGSVVGDNKAKTGLNWPTSDGTTSYGFSDDTWGTTWTASDINASNFGVVIAATGDSASADRIAEVDNLKVTIYYSENNAPSDFSGNGLTLSNNGSTGLMGGKFGSAPDLIPASNQYFSTATTISGVNSVSFWVYPDSTTNYYISLASGAYITSSSGVLSATGFANPKIYVNGVETTSISASSWQLVTVTSDTSINADQFYIGRQGSNYMDGKIDEVRLYNRVLSPSEVQSLYNWTPEPILYFPFDENTGTSTVYDRSGNGMTGTMTGSMTQDDWVTGKVGSALNFDGSNDYIAVTDNSLLDFGRYTAFTYSAWKKFPSGANVTFFHKGSEENGEYDGSVFALYSNTNNRLEILLTRDTWNYYCAVVSTTSPADDQWHHISFVFNRNASCTTNDLLIYIDGVKETTSVTLPGVNSDTNISNNDPLTIGAFNIAGTRSGFFNGSMDELKIYNYARTPAQIVEDMNAGHPAPGSPVGSAYLHYNFDEGYGTTANNSGNAGSVLNGTITSGTWTNEGKFGKAVTFTASSYLSRTITDPGYTNSISLWLKPSTSIASKTLVTTAKLTTDASSRPVYGGCTGTAIPLDTWTHLIAVSNGSGSCAIYQNGTQTSTGTTGVTFGTTVNIGNSSYTGVIDEFKFYNFALTATQAKVEHNQGHAAVFGAVSTNADGTPSQGSDRASCPPGDTTAACAPIVEINMEEKSGQYAYDTSGNANHLTLGTTTGAEAADPSWTSSCKLGSCLEFTGAQSGFITHNTQLNIGNTTDSYTVSIWAYFNQKHLSMLVKKGQEDFGDGKMPFAFETSGTGGSNLRFRIHDGTNGVSASTSQYVAGQWLHVTGVRDVAADETRLYIDGRLMAVSTDPTTVTMQRSTNIIMGKNGVNDDNYFSGKLDGLKIYNYARTPQQIAWDYNRGLPQWHLELDHSSGITAYSLGPITANATLQGNAVFNTTPGQCKNGYCVTLDGTDDYLSTGNFSPLSLETLTTTKASWGGWYYLTTSSASKALLEKGTELKLTTDASSKPVCNIYTSSAFTTNSTAASNPALSLSTWHHLLCTYDGTTIKLYQNGKQVDSWSQTGAITVTSTPAYAGSSSTGSGDVVGRLDDQYIFNYPLTPQQIDTLINKGAVNFRN